jgi:hypothetical protein
MGEPLHDIDKLFYDGIEGHSEYPPKKVWDKIEAGLDKDSAVTYKRKYQTLKRAAVILLVLLLGVVTYLLVNRKPDESRVAGSEKSNSPVQRLNTQKDRQPSGRDHSHETEQSNEEKQPGINHPDSPTVNQPAVTGNDKKTRQPITANPGDVTSATGTGNEASTAAKQGDSKEHGARPATTEKNALSRNGIRSEGKFELSDNPAGKRGRTGKQSPSNIITQPPVNNAGRAEVNEVAVKRSYEPLQFQRLKKNVDAIPPINVNVPPGGSASVLAALKTPVPNSRNPFMANRGFSVEAFFLPSTAWNNLEDDRPHQFNGSGGPGGPVQNHEEIKRNESRSTAYIYGVKINYGLGKKLSVFTGVNYSKTITKERSKTLYAETDNYGHVGYRNDCSSGYTYLLPKGSTYPTTGDRKTVSNIHNIVSYVGIPVGADYRITSGKFSLVATAGGQINLLVKGKTNAVFDKGTANEKTASSPTRGLKSSYVSGLAGIHGELKLNRSLSLTIGPSMQFGLSPINTGVSVTNRPSYFGVSGGLKLNL